MATEDIDDQSEYFIRVRGRVLGPFDVAQLKVLRGRGQFSRANEISTDRETWQSAATIEHVLVEKSSRQRNRDTQQSEEEYRVPSVQAPSASWYYAIGGEQQGPVSMIELRGLVSAKQFSPDDLVWKEGMTDWTAAGQVPELAALFNTTTSLSQGTSVSVLDPRLAATGLMNYCFACGSPTDPRAEVCPKCGVRQPRAGNDKNRTTALLLAFFLGGLGAHHFYLGNTVRAVLYLLFCWTFIPAIIAFIDLIILACMSDATFREKYGQK